MTLPTMQRGCTLELHPYSGFERRTTFPHKYSPLASSPLYLLQPNDTSHVFFRLISRNRGGLEVDHNKAFELHLKAANLGMPRAQFNTGVHYFEGTGVEQVGGCRAVMVWLVAVMYVVFLLVLYLYQVLFFRIVFA